MMSEENLETEEKNSEFHRPWFARANTPPIELPLSLPEALLPRNEQSKDEAVFHILMGPIASGKTRFRKEHFSDTVVIDPAVVYMHFTRDDTNIPENIGQLVQFTGVRLAAEALRQRLNIGIEIVPVELADQELKHVIDLVVDLGYKVGVEYQGVDDLETSLRRSKARGPLNISAYYTELDTVTWLETAIGLFRGESGRLVERLAEYLSEYIAEATIRELRSEKDVRFDPGSAVLRSLWDEIVVQRAFQYGIGWELTEDHIKGIILQHVESLSPSDCLALWLNTDVGSEWSSRDGKVEPPVNSFDIVNHMLRYFVYPKADQWALTDRRLRRYIEQLTSS